MYQTDSKSKFIANSCAAVCEKCKIVSLLNITTPFRWPFDPICNTSFPVAIASFCVLHHCFHARLLSPPLPPQLFANCAHIRSTTHLPPCGVRTGLACQRVFTLWPRAFGRLTLVGCIPLKYLSWQNFVHPY
jgi:hypothetical protein